MGERLEFIRFTRRPFSVEAVEVTDDNMDELGALIGDIRVKDDVRYIAIDRRVVPNVRKAFVGWWVTRMDDNLRCYSPEIFEEQFIEASMGERAELGPEGYTLSGDIPEGDYSVDGFVANASAGAEFVADAVEDD